MYLINDLCSAGATDREIGILEDPAISTDEKWPLFARPILQIALRSSQVLMAINDRHLRNAVQQMIKDRTAGMYHDNSLQTGSAHP
jgi:hypothetical protein